MHATGLIFHDNTILPKFEICVAIVINAPVFKDIRNSGKRKLFGESDTTKQSGA